jgi:hypothetical protein
MVKHEPEIRRAKAKLYVESQNRKVHDAPWTTGRFNGVGAGGLYEALELGQLAYKAHKLPYEDVKRRPDLTPHIASDENVTEAIPVVPGFGLPRVRASRSRSAPLIAL